VDLATVIEGEFDWIVARWFERARAHAPPITDRTAVLEDLSEVLRDLACKLRADVSRGGVIDPAPVESAQAHGRQRFGLGYDAGSMVREHGTLREVLYEAMARARYEPTFLESASLTRFLFEALAESVTTYGAERDREVREQLERYMSFLAHELRNPLGTARLALSLVEGEQQLRPARAVASLNRALDRMQELLERGLSEYAARAAPSPSCQSFSLAQFLRDVATESEPEANSKGVTTSVEVPDPVQLEANPILLRSAVSNLIRNAIKFTAPNTTVRVQGQRSTDGKVAISVADQCGGLPPGSRERLFSPFVQAGTDRSGFGLGLSIARQVSESHGGTIRADDLPGRGCVFTIELPERCA
jgi:hypothetical protein